MIIGMIIFNQKALKNGTTSSDLQVAQSPLQKLQMILSWTPTDRKLEIIW